MQKSRRNKQDLDRPYSKVKPTRYRVSRLLSLARPYWWQFAIILLAASLTSTFTIAYPALTGQIIDSAISKNVSALHSIIFLLLGLGVAQALYQLLTELLDDQYRRKGGD